MTVHVITSSPFAYAYSAVNCKTDAEYYSCMHRVYRYNVFFDEDTMLLDFLIVRQPYFRVLLSSVLPIFYSDPRSIFLPMTHQMPHQSNHG